MSKKNVYASVEIADQEVRLVVLEIFDGRFNVLRVERASCDGLKNQAIVDEVQVVKAIQDVMNQAQVALGYKIERVFLAIPSKNVRRTNQKVRVQIEDGSNSIRLFHIQQGFNKAIQRKLSDDVEFVNVNRITYIVNQQTFDTMPIDEECEYFFMDVDMIYADKETIYSYARCIEQANLEILDLCLDTYATAQESGVMVKSEERSIVQLGLDANHCTLGYFANGKLKNCIHVEKGYNWFIEEIKTKYDLSNQVCFRLLQNIFTDDEKSSGDMVVYIEQRENEKVEISSKELTRVCLKRMREWMEEINSICEPILKEGKTSYVLTGQGANISIMNKMISLLNADAISYQPKSTGARDGSFICCLGMTYAFHDLNAIRQIDKISVSSNELEESIAAIQRRSSADDGAFTKKLKNVILTEE